MTRYVRDERVLWQRTSRRVLVLAPGEPEITALVGVVALVWDALAEEVELDELVADLSEVFDRRPDEIRPELEVGLASLVDAHLVRRC